MQSVQQPQQHAESATGGLSKMGEHRQKGRDKRSWGAPCKSIKPFKLAGQSHLIVNIHKLKTCAFDPHCKSTFQEQLGDGGCDKTATQKQSPTTPYTSFSHPGWV